MIYKLPCYVAIFYLWLEERSRLIERGFAIGHRYFSGKRVFGELLKADTINYTWGILLKVTYWLKKIEESFKHTSI